MMDASSALADLLEAMFRDQADLQRFLALHDMPLEKSATSMPHLAGMVARRMLATGRANELFDALLERAPERAADIRAARESYEPSEADSPTAGEAVPQEFAGFVDGLRAVLAEARPADDLTRALDRDHFPWTAAAAVLGGFPPTRLRPVGEAAGSALTALASLVDVRPDGDWVLSDRVRSSCLRRLLDRRQLQRAVRANVDLPDGKRDKLSELVSGHTPWLGNLDTAELDEYSTVIRWLEPLDVAQGDFRSAVLAAQERRQLLDPLRALSGRHFQGRWFEVDHLTKHVHGGTSESTLLVYGPGGAGKTSLLGKVLLELEQRVATHPISFAYLDFDRSHNDPRDTAGLLAHIARQLRLQYATTEEGSVFAAHEAMSLRTDLPLASEMLDIDVGTSSRELLRLLSGRLLDVREMYGDPGGPPLVLVLDTLEEVQIKGPGAVHDLLAFVDELTENLPEMKVVMSGRGVESAFQDRNDMLKIPLGDLDPEAADEVLRVYGVADPVLRSAVVTKFGANPLTLRLAAEALTRSGMTEGALDDVVARADALAEVALEQVQGMLYGRILGHIADPEVVRVAYPGLAVRRITAEVLREVLAEPCGLDPARAEVILDKLRREVSLFDWDDPETLYHRQDVRRLMLRTMMDDPGRAAVVAKIHRRAIDFYAGTQDLRSRAERLYHQLISGVNPRLVKLWWDPDAKRLLEPALGEPLPRRARTWLTRRLGLATDDHAEWAQEDWEAEAAARARSWLASGQGARALEVLTERTERLRPSRLHALEVEAYLTLDRLDDASRALERGIQSLDGCDYPDLAAELAELAITLRGAQGDSTGVVTAARWGTASCDLSGDEPRGIDILANAIGELRRLGAEPDAAELGAELTTRFGQLSTSDLRDRPGLVLRVLHAAGAIETDLLHRAAVDLGDETEKDGGVIFRRDYFEVARLLEQTTDNAQHALTELARNVGLHSTGWTVRELASLAVRSGRTGQAIALGLDYASDVQDARELVVDKLVRPTDTPPGRYPS